MDRSPSARGSASRALTLQPRLPAVLSLALLVYQIGLIWVLGALPKQDGPSHAYTALVLCELLFRPGSVFQSFFALNSYPTSNWTSSVLLSLANLLVGPRYVEQALVTLAILFLYGAMYYAQKAPSPQQTLLWRGRNALLNVWFLWMGLYSFCLGVAIGVFCVGYYIRNLRQITAKHYVGIGLLMLVLYFTHPMAQFLAGLVLSVVCVWDEALWFARQPGEASGEGRLAGGIQNVLRSYAPLLLSMAPSAVFLLIFARAEKLGSAPSALSLKELGSRLLFFPAYVFNIQSGDFFLQMDHALCAVILLAIFSSVLLWKEADWLSTQGGVVAAAIIMFGIYLIIPEEGGEAAFLKERVAWTIVIFPSVAVSARVRSRALITTLAARSANRAREIYLPVEQMVRPGSTLLRLNYPAEKFEQKYNLVLLNYDPILHAVDGVALRRRCVNWSNYEAVSKAFAAVYRSLTPAEKILLGGLKRERQRKRIACSPSWHGFLRTTSSFMASCRSRGKSPGADQRLADDFRTVLGLLSRQYNLIGISGEGPVLRLYRKKM